jgi:transcriptional regulator with XRE-family HTH domain
MLIGERLRSLREEKQLSQGDIEKRTGLLRCYVSRVENGHTVPAVETLEKFARALEVPTYQLLYEVEEPPSTPMPGVRKSREWGCIWTTSPLSGKVYVGRSRQMRPEDRELLLYMTERMTGHKR